MSVEKSSKRVGRAVDLDRANSMRLLFICKQGVVVSFRGLLLFVSELLDDFLGVKVQLRFRQLRGCLDCYEVLAEVALPRVNEQCSVILSDCILEIVEELAVTAKEAAADSLVKRFVAVVSSQAAEKHKVIDALANCRPDVLLEQGRLSR